MEPFVDNHGKWYDNSNEQLLLRWEYLPLVKEKRSILRNGYDARIHTKQNKRTKKDAKHKQGTLRLSYSFYFYIVSCLSTDLAEFPVPDPWNTRQFRYNGYDLFWEDGLPPNYEPCLYVIVGHERFLIGRFIQSCQVTTCTKMC